MSLRHWELTSLGPHIRRQLSIWRKSTYKKVTPTLKSNAGDQMVCKKKNLSWLFGVDRKIRPSGSLFSITRKSLVMQNSDPRTDVSIMKDSYNDRCRKVQQFMVPDTFRKAKS